MPETHGRSAAGVSATQQRPGAADGDHRRPARQQLAQRDEPPARGDPQPGRDDPRHDQQRRRHLGLEAEADADAREHDPARAAVLQPADRRPQRADAAEDQQRVGVVVARDRDCDRRGGEREARDEAGRAAPQAARQVIDEPDRRDAHQRLRHEQAQGVEAEHLHERHLDPGGERRLVDGHRAGCIERAVEERVPARAHRAHGGAVVLVGPAVLGQAPQVQDAGDQQEQGQLGPHAAQRVPARRGGGRGGRLGGGGRARGGRRRVRSQSWAAASAPRL